MTIRVVAVSPTGRFTRAVSPGEADFDPPRFKPDPSVYLLAAEPAASLPNRCVAVEAAAGVGSAPTRPRCRRSRLRRRVARAPDAKDARRFDGTVRRARGGRQGAHIVIREFTDLLPLVTRASKRTAAKTASSDVPSSKPARGLKARIICGVARETAVSVRRLHAGTRARMKQSAVYETRYTIRYTRDTPRVLPHPRRFTCRRTRRDERGVFSAPSVTSAKRRRPNDARDVCLSVSLCTRRASRASAKAAGPPASRAAVSARAPRLARSSARRGRDTPALAVGANPRHLGGRGACPSALHGSSRTFIAGNPPSPRRARRPRCRPRGASASRNARGTLRWPPPTWTR